MPATRTNRLLIGAAGAIGVFAGAAGIAAAVTEDDGSAGTPVVSEAAAEEAALAEVPGRATVSELELDDGEWTVDVVGDDGSRHEVDVDATTGEVVGTERDGRDGGTDVRDDDGDDADDAAEDAAEAEADAALAADAAVGQEQAEQTALGEAPGTVHRTEIEREDGRVVWDVEVDGDDGRRHDVQIDAESGAVVEHDVDD